MKRIAVVTAVLLSAILLLVFRDSFGTDSSASTIGSEPIKQPKQMAPDSQHESTETEASNLDVTDTNQVGESAKSLEADEKKEVFPKFVLDQILKPQNVINDSDYGVSVTYPKDWSVKAALRFGANKNTIFFNPPEGSKAVPSMYYQKFTESPPDPAYAEAVMREQARKKEESRLKNGIEDYANDPDSFEYREIDGNPSLSYFATYTQGDDVEAEYFTRIIGEDGYVMFFVRGPVDDVSALITPVRQMSETVTPP